jgi:hypothetical protein
MLASIGGILAGVAMIRAGLFGRAAGWVVVIANVVGLGIFLPGVGVVVALASVLLLWAWFLRIGWGFLRLARDDRTRAVPAPSAAVTDPAAA